MPGFVDAHTHLFFGGEQALGLSFDESQQWALENGITTIGQAYINPDRLDRMLQYEQEGRLIIRTSLYMRHTNNCGDIIDNFWVNYPQTDGWGERLRIGGVKVFTDGGTCGAPAVSFEYLTGGYGDLFFTQEELNTIISDIHNSGHQAVFHAQGDRAMEQCLNAIEYVIDGNPNTTRHRIDHNSYVRSDIRPRYSEIGVAPVIFGEFYTCTEQGIIDYIGTDPLPWFENWKALLEDNPGLPIAWHSDAPNLEINPFYNINCYVTRKEITNDGTVCEPSDWNKAQVITVEQALPLMTTGAAYALFREDEVGSLTPGKLADIIVISDNPLTVDPDSIAGIHVLMTMVGGDAVYCRPGNESLCPENLGISTPDFRPTIGSINISPNPAFGNVDFQFSIFNFQRITIKIYDIHGRAVAIVLDEKMPAGEHLVRYDASGLPDGIYFVRMQAGETAETGKVVKITE